MELACYRAHECGLSLAPLASDSNNIMLWGACNHGDQCRFAHSLEELRARQVSVPSKVTAHSDPPTIGHRSSLLPSAALVRQFKTLPCNKWWTRGHCSYGAKCGALPCAVSIVDCHTLP